MTDRTKGSPSDRLSEIQLTKRHTREDLEKQYERALNRERDHLSEIDRLKVEVESLRKKFISDEAAHVIESLERRVNKLEAVREAAQECLDVQVLLPGSYADALERALDALKEKG